jgi:drug/metabolite transporter (DMT)-like permease
VTAEAAPAVSAVTRAPAPGWQVWGALWIVYLVWGSTYLAIRVMVETVPPLLGAGARFGVAGAVMLVVLAVRRGVAAVRPTRAALLGAGLVGLLLPGANAVVAIAEQQVPSGLAALLIGSIPLWVIVLRRLAGEPVSRASAIATTGFT